MIQHLTPSTRTLARLRRATTRRDTWQGIVAALVMLVLWMAGGAA